MVPFSLLLVLGASALILFNLAAVDGSLRPGFAQMIHARIPWLLLALLWTGGGLAIAALLRKPTRARVLTLLLELPVVLLASWYFLFFSFLPARSLAVGPGDPFPAYALLDQEERLRRFDPATARQAALYIFYRGDW